MFGVFGTTWYYRLDLPGVKEFVAKYQKTYPGVQIKVPGNVFLNGYLATRELLRVVEEAGATNNIAVIKKLEGRKMSAARPHAAPRRVDRPGTHQVQQTIYMASYNDKPAETDDIFKILAQRAAAGSRRPGRAEGLQAGDLRGDAELRSSRAWMFLANLLPHLLNGVSLGLLFALIALGFMLIVGVMEVINLAHGSLFALGAYCRHLPARAQKFPFYVGVPARAAARGAGRDAAGSSACAAPTARTRSTACCSPSARRW